MNCRKRVPSGERENRFEDVLTICKLFSSTTGLSELFIFSYSLNFVIINIIRDELHDMLCILYI